MWVVYFLKCYTNLLVYFEQYKQQVLTKARQLLGQDPEQVFVLSNGDVVSSRYTLGAEVPALVYNPETNRLHPRVLQGAVRFRPSSILALSVRAADRTLCLDEWIGTFRVFDCPDLSLQQLVALWSVANHVYIKKGTPIYGINDEGTDVTGLT
jgi:hypothetical protein